MRSWKALMVLLAPLVILGCSSSDWSNEDALASRSLEVQVDHGGAQTEIEYKIDPMATPAEVRAAMDRLHPGGPYRDAEKEWNDGDLYYELSRVVGGLEVEAMFSPDGRLHSEEVQVPAGKVPGTVKGTVDTRWPRGRVVKWEEIRDGDRTLRQYHVKLQQGGKKYKVALTPGGEVLGVWREMPAEIEVPVSSRD